MRQWKCDRCGATSEAKDETGQIPSDWTRLTFATTIPTNLTLDLCGQCRRDVERFAKEGPPQAASYSV